MPIRQNLKTNYNESILVGKIWAIINLKENKVANHEEVVVDELSEVEYQFQGYITGFFHYRHHWTPKIGEKLTTSPDKDNAYDAYAVNVIKDQKTTVGHVPHQISEKMKRKSRKDFYCRKLGKWKSLR